MSQRPSLGKLLFGRVPRKYRRLQVKLQKLALIFAAVLTVLIVIGAVAAVKHAVKVRAEKKAQAEAEAKALEGRDITIGGTGCTLLHDPFLRDYTTESGYDFSDCFKYISSYYSAPDYMTAEMESSLTDDTLNYSAFPSFRSPEAIIENLSGAGVDLQLLATNHIYDGGDYGFDRTLDAYEERNLNCTGIVRDSSDKRYYIAEIDGIKVGFVNYTYGTQDYFNSIVLPDEIAARINMFDENDLDQLYSEMKTNIAGMRADGAQFLIANMHWGEEYNTQQNEVQEAIAAEFCEMGIDAIIGGHPHVVQPMDYLTSKDGSHSMFVIYSVANILSNQMAEYMDNVPSGHTEDGVMVTLTLHEDAEKNVTLKDVNVLPTWCHRENINEGSDNEQARYYILPLDDIDGLESLTGLTGIKDKAQASYDRTMEILQEGLSKTKDALGTNGAADDVPEENAAQDEKL